jgi:hypothetical protein
MPSLRDVAHNGCIAWIYYKTGAGNSIGSQLGSSCQCNRYGTEKCRRYGPSITHKITPAGSLYSSQPGGPPWWASPLAFGLFRQEILLPLLKALKLLSNAAREYWIFIQNQDFLRFYDLAPPPPHPSPDSKLSPFLSLPSPVRLTEGRRWLGVGEEPNHTTVRKPGFL